MAHAIGEALVAGIAYAFENVVVPWWKRTAWSYIKEMRRKVVNAVNCKRETKVEQINNKQNQSKTKQTFQLESVVGNIKQMYNGVKLAQQFIILIFHT